MKSDKKILLNSKFDIDKPDPEAEFRFYSVVYFTVILSTIGLPVWWMTTRVYRASLPLDQMYNVELKNRTDKALGLPLSTEYDILITIVNPDPLHLKVDLDGELLDINLQQFIGTISSVANFTVKSQWLYLADLGVTPRKFEDYFVLSKEQLPHTITPLEKRLWSQMSPRPCINLVLYVSTCRVPLFIHEEGDVILKTNSFISARWGAISILNPDVESCQVGVYKPPLEPIISNFIKQLRQLLQIKGKLQSDEYDFKISRINQMVDSTRRTLKSLAQLLSEISSIVISDDVADKIKVAVENADKADEYLLKNDVEMALTSAKVAYEHSEAAFGDKSLLALLYFPEDQKYAVYIPLFLPILIPVVMSAITIKRWYLPYKKCKEKIE